MEAISVEQNFLAPQQITGGGYSCLIMDSVSEQAIENSLNNQLLLPPKPARQPNPVYRKSRRGSSNGGRNPGKQIERYTNNKELLRTKAFLTNTTSHDKVLAYNKGYVNDDEEDWITESDEEQHLSMVHVEKGKQELEMSIQKSTKKGNKKTSYVFDRRNKESSHMIYVQDIIETRDSHKEKLQTRTSNCKSFIQFCSRELICPQEHRAALAVKLYGVQAALLSGLGNPFENLSQSMSSRNNNNNNNSHALVLSLRQASTGFLPAIIWTGMFTLSFVYTVIVVWSLDFQVPIISMLCLSLLYCLSLLVAAASEFNVMCSIFRISGILFASLGVLSFVLLLFVLVMLLLFVSWWRTEQGLGKN